MHYRVPAPLMHRLVEFLDDNPSPTASRLRADLQRDVRPAEPVERVDPEAAQG